MKYEYLRENRKTRYPQILVVEDDPDIRELITMVLTKVDHWSITSVDCGAKAVSVWSSRDFDVIIMDVGLPRMDGISATKKIRKMEDVENMVNTPIIGLTAQSDSIKECKEAGMNEFMTKPFRPSELIERVEKYLDQICPL